VDGAEKEVKKRVEMGGPKRVLNCRKVAKTEAFRRIGPETLPGGNPKMGT
jgi:hypothetical protein